MGRVDLVAIIASAILLGYIIEAVRRRLLREEYSILWLLTAAVLLLLALIRPALDILARALGIISPVNALFVVGFAFTTVILLHFSTVVSRLSRENRELAQRHALLVYRLRRDDGSPCGEMETEARREPFAAESTSLASGNDGGIERSDESRVDG